MPSGPLAWILGTLYALPLVTLLQNLWYWAWVERRRVVPPAWPSLAVLIPARDEEENLGRLLPSLTTQDYPDVAIVVYDDASSDGTAAVARALGGPQLTLLRGTGPPPGWIGKPHACHQAAAAASADLLLFLDADTELRHPGALRALVSRYLGMPQPGVLTGMPHFAGGGLLLVSGIMFWVCAMLPLALAARLKRPGMGALNGQCWLVDRALYQRLQPHAHFADEIVEDVKIGRWLLGQGIVPWAAAIGDDLTTWMYRSIPDAWQGFRKNFYVLSGHPVSFVLTSAAFIAGWLVLPVLYPVLWVPLFLVRIAADRLSRMPWWVTPALPVTLILAIAVYTASALSHWRGNVMWKTRNVFRHSTR